VSVVRKAIRASPVSPASVGRPATLASKAYPVRPVNVAPRATRGLLVPPASVVLLVLPAAMATTEQQGRSDRRGRKVYRDRKASKVSLARLVPKGLRVPPARKANRDRLGHQGHQARKANRERSFVLTASRRKRSSSTHRVDR
jgi:hypothetical protein